MFPALDYKNSFNRYRRYAALFSEQPLARAGFFVILTLVTTILLLIFALRPTLITISSLLGQIREKKELDRRLDAKITSLTQAQQAYQRAEPKLAYLDAALPIDPVFGAWADTVGVLAQANGLTVTDIALTRVPITIQANTATLPEGALRVGFSVATRGQYEQMRQFVQTLENLRRIVKIESARVARVDASGSQLALTLNGAVGISP